MREISSLIQKKNKPNPRKVSIQAGTRSKVLEIPTIADDEKELNDRIVATIQTNTNYDVGAFSTSSIIVIDNDDVAFSAPSISLESLSTTGITEGQKC